MQHATLHRSTKFHYYLIIFTGLFFFFFSVGVTLLPQVTVSASGPEPTAPPEPTSWLNSPRLKKPALPLNPTMAEKGAIPYWSICLSCHGDKGQGLTDEWRQAGFGEDNNCWKSKCHASNHPTPGFNFPRLVPPVIGNGTLQRFTTALELKNYIKSTMPWWDPGSLSETDSWNLTAYLLRENGVLPVSANLDKKESDITPVHFPIRDRQAEFSGQYLISILLGLAAIILVANWGTGKDAISFPSTTSRPNFFYHLHPPTIPGLQARWRYTLGAGGLAVFLTLIVILTGILEMFFYIPTPIQAGLSIQTITFMVPYGGLVRGLHFWAAQILVVVSGIHLLRILFTGSYTSPRRFNFYLGLLLFILLLFLDFTGYILRWDNGIHWALIVGTNLLAAIPIIGEKVYQFVVGGITPGLATLTRFYAWHIFGLTIITIIILGWHLFRVRRDGGISAPPPNQRADKYRISRIELVRLEVLVMLVIGAALILLVTQVPAPLAAPIKDAGIPLSPDVRAPWFFLWVQQLLRFGDAFWMGVAIPLGAIILLASLPIIFHKNDPTQKGYWFPSSGRIIQVITGMFVIAWLALTIMELLK